MQRKATPSNSSSIAQPPFRISESALKSINCGLDAHGVNKGHQRNREEINNDEGVERNAEFVELLLVLVEALSLDKILLAGGFHIAADVES